LSFVIHQTRLFSYLKAFVGQVISAVYDIYGSMRHMCGVIANYFAKTSD